MTTDPIILTQNLVRCPSITPKDEGAQAVLTDILKGWGFSTETLVFGEIINFFSRLGTEGPHICFAGHTDVVPVGDENSWTYPPFGAVIADGRLFGRGTADMKANIACFVAAVGRYLQKHGQPKGSISFLITGDEEGPAVDGTIKVLEWMKAMGQIPDAAIVGEPSNPEKLGDEIKIGRRGSLVCGLTVHGVQGHTAYPQRADNPLPRLIKMLDALCNYTFDNGSEFFPATNLQVTSVDVGNKASNVIPASGTAKFNVRFCDKWSSATLIAKIHEILDSCGGKYELTTSCNAESFITQPGPFTKIVQDAVHVATGRVPAMTTGGGTSDARFISKYCQVVELGLINETIHKVDEYVRVDDVEKLTQIYLDILERYFK